jgi:hypothetical protein
VYLAICIARVVGLLKETCAAPCAARGLMKGVRTWTKKRDG